MALSIFSQEVLGILLFSATFTTLVVTVSNPVLDLLHDIFPVLDCPYCTGFHVGWVVAIVDLYDYTNFWELRTYVFLFAIACFSSLLSATFYSIDAIISGIASKYLDLDETSPE